MAGLQATCSAGSRSALQLRKAVGDLSGFAETRAAERLERLAADRELVQRLALHGYEGTEWKKFATALAEYGFQVMKAWIKSGLVFAKCASKGVGLRNLHDVPRSDDDAGEIAGETVALAIRSFREKVLVPKRWDPTKGATLKTFFIGQCLFQFPNTIRRWASERNARPVDDATLGSELALRQARPSTEVLAQLSRGLEILAKLPKQDPTCLKVLMEMGYSQEEIGEMLGTSEKAIEMRLYRSRQKQGTP